MNNLEDLKIKAEETSKAIGERSYELANWVHEMMEDLAIYELESADIEKRTYRTSCGIEDGLMFNGQDLLNRSMGGGYYLHGDYNCWIDRPTRDTVTEFFEVFPAIVDELKKISELPEMPELPGEKL